MARIYTYPNDTRLQDEDAWIGTNKVDLATVQFTAQKIADYLNLDGKISINGQIAFKYEYGQLSAEKTMAIPGPSSSVNFSDITTLYLHKNDIAGQFVPNFLAVLINKEILISEVGNINNFGHYLVTSYSANLTNPDFYDIELVAINSNGNLIDLQTYAFCQFNLSGDKTFIFTQGATSATWNITHNLNKYPSVSVVDSGNNLIYPEVLYNSTTEITLTFKAGLSGKAYLN